MRVQVIELLLRSGRPLSVPQILGKIKASHVDTVTVYRTLNTFARKKLVHRVRGEDRSWRYALSVDLPGSTATPPQHQHPHFVCDRCGKVECLQRSRIPGSLLDSLGIDRHYAVSYSEVVVHGQCPKCQ